MSELGRIFPPLRALLLDALFNDLAQRFRNLGPTNADRHGLRFQHRGAYLGSGFAVECMGAGEEFIENGPE